MGGKKKPAFVLANRDAYTGMDYGQLKAYREKALPPLHAKADKLNMELSEHLGRLRVKHEIDSDGICIFPDADWGLRTHRIQFTPQFFNWPEIPNGRMRLSFLKDQPSASPTWFRVKKVSVLEPVSGFDTLALAKNLQALRNEFIAKRKAKNLEHSNRAKSTALHRSVKITEELEEVFDIDMSSSIDPERFYLKITYKVTKAEAEEILARLRT